MIWDDIYELLDSVPIIFDLKYNNSSHLFISYGKVANTFFHHIVCHYRLFSYSDSLADHFSKGKKWVPENAN